MSIIAAGLLPYYSERVGTHSYDKVNELLEALIRVETNIHNVRRRKQKEKPKATTKSKFTLKELDRSQHIKKTCISDDETTSGESEDVESDDFPFLTALESAYLDSSLSPDEGAKYRKSKHTKHANENEINNNGKSKVTKIKIKS